VKTLLQVGEGIVLDHDAIQVALEKDPIAQAALIVVDRHHRRTGRGTTEGENPPTIRPLAREIAGISRAISGVTDPVTSNRAGAFIRFAVTNVNCSGFSTVTRPVLPVSVTFACVAVPSAGLNFFSHAVSRRQTARYAAALQISLLAFISGSSSESWIEWANGNSIGDVSIKSIDCPSSGTFDRHARVKYLI
jgi:hypothetical protein